jgi:hypothetical protein
MYATPENKRQYCSCLHLLHCLVSHVGIVTYSTARVCATVT